MNTRKPANRWLVAAAILMFATALIHIFAGGPDIYAPLRSASLPGEVKSTLSVVWHMVTVFLFLAAGALAWLSKNYDLPLAGLIGLSQAAFAVLFVSYSLVDTGSLMALPQWTVFALGAVLMLIGHRREA